VERGVVVILRNSNWADGHYVPCGVGAGLRTKVSVNIGMSPDWCDPAAELAKGLCAVECGADLIMDLSISGDMDSFRRQLLAELKVPVGTNPMYQAAKEALEREGEIARLQVDDLLATIEKHVSDGCGWVTLHCAMTRQLLSMVEASSGRIMKMTSRGGSLVAAWMRQTENENPLYSRFDEILEILKSKGASLSIGSSLRAGSVADGPDDMMLRELLLQGELAERSRARGVPVRVEAPLGHIRLDEINDLVKLSKTVCQGAPIGALGPLATDIAPGYDHITHAIGCALAVAAGLDYTSAVYPTEHVGLPTIDDVQEGIYAARIAAHAGDIVKLGEKALTWDARISEARAALKWQLQFDLSINPTRAREMYKRVRSSGGACSVCGASFCAHKLGRAMDRG